MLKRLQAVPPTYNSLQWEVQRQSQERELQDKCKYPHIFKSEELASVHDRREMSIMEALSAKQKLQVQNTYIGFPSRTMVNSGFRTQNPLKRIDDLLDKNDSIFQS